MFQDLIIITKKNVHMHPSPFSFNMLCIPVAGILTVDHSASAVELFGTVHSFLELK